MDSGDWERFVDIQTRILGLLFVNNIMTLFFICNFQYLDELLKQLSEIVEKHSNVDVSTAGNLEETLLLMYNVTIIYVLYFSPSRT